MLIDVIIISLSNTTAIVEMTKRAIQSCRNSERNDVIKWNFIVVESQKDAQPYDNCTMLYPDEPFNYNGYINYALPYCKGEYIAMCNNDLIFRTNWATILIKEMKKYGALSASPMSDQAILQRPFKNLKEPLCGYRVSLHISGWCLLAHKSVFDKIGKLRTDNTFWCSDTWYAKQLEESRILHIMVPYAKVYHVCSQTLNKLPKQKYIEYTSEQTKKFRRIHKDENKNHIKLPNPVETVAEIEPETISPEIVAIFNVWNGEETLEESIKNSIDCGCDVFVLFSEISNRGKKCTQKIREIINRLRDNKTLKSLIYYTPDLSVSPQQNTVKKLNEGLIHAKNCGYKYVIFKDADEFHEPDKFKEALRRFISSNYDSSYCNIKTYYFDEIHYFNEDYHVPFVYKITDSNIEFGAELKTATCDPCRKLGNPGKSILLNPDEIVMHHFSYLRNDLNDKYENANSADAVKNNYKKIISGLEKFKETGKATVFCNGGKSVKEIEVQKLETPIFKFNMKIDIVAVTYGHNENLKCFINSIKSQTNQNWRLILLHDGPNPEQKKELENLGYLQPGKVEYIETKQRLQHYGHPMRRWALQNIDLNEFVCLTNGDNYYAPVFVDEVLKNSSFDFIHYNCVHSHLLRHVGNKEKYGVLSSELKNSHIDMGQAVIRSSFAKKAGFNSDEFAADWIYFLDVLKLKPKTKKIDKYLFVHN